ncbi:MAG: RNA methyltransferase [Burkholderiales bacterium]|nr:RNA methyltransferase [Burkholderiales bacterium]
MTSAETEPAVVPADTSSFVLVEPSHAGNVGAAARAIKVMGFSRLVLVRPRTAGLHLEGEAVARASGAADVLEAARTVTTLAEALQGSTLACATAMTPRDFGPPTQAPREALPAAAAAGHRVAFVFGPERTGLANDDVYRCHLCLSIPTHPDYGSLNLAQAVQLIAYDWRQALGGFAVRSRTAEARWADAAAVQGLLEHWREALVAIGFLDPAAPKKLLPRLNQLANRARLTEEEVHILRGIARAAATAAAAAGSGRAATPAAGADMNRHPRSRKG